MKEGMKNMVKRVGEKKFITMKMLHFSSEIIILANIYLHFHLILSVIICNHYD